MTNSRDEPTAWEEINPTTALARQPEQPATCLALSPATREEFGVELTACLALVVPVGMTEEARREWLSVAWQTLKELPGDILSDAAAEARKTCDHPSKIVPAIQAFAEERLARRKRIVREYPLSLPSPTKRSVMDRRGESMSETDTAELNSILENLGATARYRPDGSRYTLQSQAAGAGR